MNDAIITARKRSLGQGNISTPVCHSVHRGGVCLNACWDTTPAAPRANATPPTACWEIRSTRGRYVSYWNAILFSLNFANF